MSSKTSAFLAAILVLIAIMRICSTYGTLSHVFDEAHFAAGLEYLSDGTYFYERQHPPLARIALAVGPYLSGMRPTHQPTIWAEANELLGSGPGYWHRLALARIGVLPFFGLACLVLWFWTRQLFGAPAALAAVGLFTMLPPVLAHAGLATLDMASAATVFAAGYAWFRWLRAPGMGVVLGLAIAAAVLTKLSALLFLPVIFAAVWCMDRRVSLAHVASLGIALCVTLAACALVYRGDLDALAQGIGDVWAHGRNGHASWLMGQYSASGWWYFFPVVLAVKTPLSFLGLAAAGARRALLPLLCAAGILAVVLPSRINLGVRHILIIYPFLAMMAGAGCVWLWRRRFVSSVLMGSLLASSLMAHPDYLAYFNPLAGSHPEHVLAESDLDWGQDLGLLAVELRSRGIDRVWLSYFGSAEPARFGISYQELPMGVPVTGWVAVSVHSLTIGSAMSGGGLDWLAKYQPVAMVGKSIRIYRVGQ